MGHNVSDTVIYAILKDGDIIPATGVTSLDWQVERGVTSGDLNVIITIRWENGEQITRRGPYESITDITRPVGLNEKSGQEVALFPLGRLLIDESILREHEKKSND